MKSTLKLLLTPKRKLQKDAELCINSFFEKLLIDPFTLSQRYSPSELCLQNEFERIQNIVSSDERPLIEHPALPLLRILFKKLPPYMAVIDIRSVGSVSGSRDPFVNDLDALPQTVNHNALYDPEIGCLDYKGIRKLRREVYNSFFHTTKTERVFTITEREWDGHRTAHNSDGSHRFSYWRQLALIPTVPYRIRARIVPFSLNEKAFLSLISSWRIVAVTRSGEGVKDAMDMATFWPEGFCPITRDRYNNSSQDYWIIPQPHMAPLDYRDPLITVHQKLDELRPFEPLRVIAEQRVMPTASKPWRKDRLRRETT